jgi:hypothetical protein
MKIYAHFVVHIKYMLYICSILMKVFTLKHVFMEKIIFKARVNATGKQITVRKINLWRENQIIDTLYHDEKQHTIGSNSGNQIYTIDQLTLLD